MATSVAAALVVAAALLAPACGDALPDAAPLPTDVVEPALLRLEMDEAALRARTDFSALPPARARLGPDPRALVRVGPDRVVGLLYGADAVVLLHDSGVEIDRADVAGAPLEVELTPADSSAPSVCVHPLLADAGVAFAVRGDRLIRSGTSCGGPAQSRLRHAAAGGWHATVDVIGHTATLVGPAGQHHVVRNDGPIWTVALRPAEGGVLVALGHIEDHPLDRSGGSFGFIDSFVSVLRVPSAGEPAARARVNTSALGVVTPKALAFLDDTHLLVTGAASATACVVDIDTGAARMLPAAWGINAVVQTPGGYLAASPLLDAWVVQSEGTVRIVPVQVAPAQDGLSPAGAARTSGSRIGEALVLTTLMAPQQNSDGPLSRFSCEACHADGGIDGRIHNTGRGDVRATTKPLWGLFNNPPLFTRALDVNLTRMAHAEFRVANANSPQEPWAARAPADIPALAQLGVTSPLSPEELRADLVAFLFDFTPPQNPRTVGRTHFTAREDAGADAFLARCARCHAPHRVGADAATAVPRALWQELIFAPNAPLVWSSAGYHDTGITPAVHPLGARASSLRRIADKTPLFTNGSAADLDMMLAHVRIDGARFLHAPLAGTPLPADEQTALRAFLLLL